MDSIFSTIKTIGSSSSSKTKQAAIVSIVSKCEEAESVRYFIRALGAELRVGATFITVVDAVVEAAVLHELELDSANNIASNKSIVEKVKLRQAEFRLSFNQNRNLARIVGGLLNSDETLPTSEIHTPITPMLAEPSKSIADAKLKLKLTKEGKYSAEFKYDGMRAAVHYSASDSKVTIWSRDSADITRKNETLVNYLVSAIGESSASVGDFVLDGEIVAFDRGEGGGILPFQVLSTRKDDEMAESNKIDVVFLAFDLLMLGEKDFVKDGDGYYARRKKMKETFGGLVKHGVFGFAEVMDFECGQDDEVEKVQEFLSLAIAKKTEGVMLKAASSYNVVSRNGSGWVKLKKDYIDGMCDTLDCVVVGAWAGTGRKVGLFSPFLCCVRNSDGEFESICRVMSLTDEMYKAKFEKWNGEGLAEEKPAGVVTNENCQFWFEPETYEVWEIKGADLTLSGTHKSCEEFVGEFDGKLKASHHVGVGLRFPRFCRVREDKGVEQATGGDVVWRLYNEQF